MSYKGDFARRITLAAGMLASAISLPAHAAPQSFIQCAGSTGVPLTGVKASFRVDVAMIRYAGKLSSSPTEFVEGLPDGVRVLPYGTSYLVHASGPHVKLLSDHLEDEGERKLMAGASSPILVGEQAASAVGYCGGAGELKRFPTPRVLRAGADYAILEAEGLNVRVVTGDMLLVVQSPQWGRGLEVGAMRFGGL